MKCDGTRAETRFRLSANRTSPIKSAGASVQSTRRAHQLLLLVVKLDTPYCEVVLRVLATHSIRQFPLHFPYRAPLCAITFQLESTSVPGGRRMFLSSSWAEMSGCVWNHCLVKSELSGCVRNL